MKTVLITGASRGIGAKTAEVFAKVGYAVVLNCDKSVREAQALCDDLAKKGCAAEVFAADVADFDQCLAMTEHVVKKYKHIDVLVNNAGISLIKPLYDTSASEFERMMQVNAGGVFNMCKAVHDRMVSAKHGAIVNVSSVWGERGSSCEAAYCASKAAVNALTKALAKELGPSGITVNCVAPGFIDTKMNAALDKQTVAEVVDQTPLARQGCADDVAQAILFLAQAKFVTGQILTVDGGWQV